MKRNYNYYLNNYEQISQLGIGKVETLYKATDKNNSDLEVAAKII